MGGRYYEDRLCELLAGAEGHILLVGFTEVQGNVGVLYGLASKEGNLDGKVRTGPYTFDGVTAVVVCHSIIL